MAYKANLRREEWKFIGFGKCENALRDWLVDRGFDCCLEVDCDDS
jgi:hypothetical protein